MGWPVADICCSPWTLTGSSPRSSTIRPRRGPCRGRPAPSPRSRNIRSCTWRWSPGGTWTTFVGWPPHRRGPCSSVATAPNSPALVRSRVPVRRGRVPVRCCRTGRTLSGPATWSGVHLTTGKEVVELSVLDVTKGGALIRLRDELGLPAAGGGVAYIGDDVTDERAFAVLDDGLGDLTVKVGAGTTAARHRIPDPPAVTRLLEMFLDLLPR
ncbi:MAG: trehalose-phosphatase [Kineosporiaceae bacterium]